MNISTQIGQNDDSRMISITQVRRDIDRLKDILADQKDAIVMRNQTVAFVVISPNRYEKLMQPRSERISKAVGQIDALRTLSKKGHVSASENIITMRDRQFVKWKK